MYSDTEDPADFLPPFRMSDKFDIEEEVRKACKAGVDVRISQWHDDSFDAMMLCLAWKNGTDTFKVMEAFVNDDFEKYENRMRTWERMWKRLQREMVITNG